MTLEDEDREAEAAGTGAPRVTLELMESHIVAKAFLTGDQIAPFAETIDNRYADPAEWERLTLCILKMQNGFMISGLSAPVSAANYNAQKGREIAYGKCITQLWSLEGYALANELMQQ